jgi:hypothetical protein
MRFPLSILCPVLFIAACDLHIAGTPTHVELLQPGRIVARWSSDDTGLDLRSGVILSWSVTTLEDDADPWGCATYQPYGTLAGQWYEACDVAWQTSELRPGDDLLEGRVELGTTVDEARIHYLGMYAKTGRRLLLESARASAPPDFQRGTPDLLLWCPLGSGLEGDGSECVPIEQAMRDPRVTRCWTRNAVTGATQTDESCAGAEHLQPQIRQRRTLQDAPDEIRRVVGAADPELGDVLAIRGETLSIGGFYPTELGVWISRTDYTDSVEGRPSDISGACTVAQAEIAVNLADGDLVTQGLADFGPHVPLALDARETRMARMPIPEEWAGQDVFWSARMTGSGKIGPSLNEDDTAPRLCVGGYSSSDRDVLPAGDHHFWGGVSTTKLYSLLGARYENRPDFWPEYKCGVAWRYQAEVPESFEHCPITEDPCRCVPESPSCFSFGEGFLCGFAGPPSP